MLLLVGELAVVDWSDMPSMSAYRHRAGQCRRILMEAKGTISRVEIGRPLHH
jgi:hypothetical protein